jgi:hypothetical protein
MDLKSFQNLVNKLKNAMTLKVTRGEIKSFVIHINGDDRKIEVEIKDNNEKTYEYVIKKLLEKETIHEQTFH